MPTYRRSAAIIGALFIIGTVAGILSVVATAPVLNDPDSLARIAGDGNRLVIGALLVLTMGLALALVPVVLYPIARNHNHPLALGYVVFRGALEPIAYIGMVIHWLALIALSREYQAGAADAAAAQLVSAALLATNDALSKVLILLFGLGALMLYALLYQSRLIPRWLSVWGLIAIVMHLATAFLLLFDRVDQMEPILFVLNFPIFLQEMVMAVWLIVKGFSPADATRATPAPGYEQRVQGHI
ncbi:MAG: DUF4386 domain-containing protein [Oscillochloris sp.]|nr:DUF4386 domain-containing protein [Oscillochloris sp.]